MIHCVVFDFDGTLIHSNEIKRRGFFEIIEPSLECVARMQAILDDPPGDRTAIISTYAHDTNGDMEALLCDYTKWTNTKIRKCAKRAGAQETLRQLSARDIRIYVNSATPTLHLIPAVQAHFGEFNFAGMLGGHGRKSENLRSILKSEQLKPAEILVVGDGVDDHASATDVGTAFCGVGGGSLVAHLPDLPVTNNLGSIPSTFAFPAPLKV